MDIDIEFRSARPGDLAAIVSMLADDPLGATRERYESPLPESYARAFEAIDRDENIELIVGCSGGSVVAVLQLTFTPHLSHQGGWRASIEGVRVASNRRGTGIGQALIEKAIARAREKSCRLIQLTTHKTREDAQRFYERLGFNASHKGMKLYLTDKSS